jgi:hypothetical protein
LVEQWRLNSRWKAQGIELGFFVRGGNGSGGPAVPLQGGRVAERQEAAPCGCELNEISQFQNTGVMLEPDLDSF